MKKLIVLLTVLIVLAVGPVALAMLTVDIEDGESHTFNNNIYRNDRVRLDYHTANDPGTHVDLVNGGMVFSLTVYNNGSIAMPGGTVEERILARDNSTVHMSGGLVDYGLIVLDNSTITMSGGTVGVIYADRDSAVTISGGTIQSEFVSHDNSAITMSGGVAREAHSHDNSTITMSGGVIERDFRVYDSATVYLEGSNFRVNGTSLVNGDKLSNFVDFFDNRYHGIITGTLADGSTLNNYFSIWNTGGHAGTGDIIIIPEPCSLVLLGLGGLVLRRRKS